MKNLGTLDNGHLLVECTVNEYETFRRLIQTVSGKKLRAYASYQRDDDTREPVDVDLSKALGAIQEWIDIEERSKALRKLADEIDQAIGL